MDTDLIARKALEEHEILDREIQDLKAILEQPPGESTDHWFNQCRDQFRHFHTQLRRHIEVEEQDGFMKPVRERRPTLTPILDQMLRDHRDMLAQCVAIENFLYDCAQAGEGDIARLQQDTAALLEIQGRHEAAENKLIQEVFTFDLGAGD